MAARKKPATTTPSDPSASSAAKKGTKKGAEKETTLPKKTTGKKKGEAVPPVPEAVAAAKPRVGRPKKKSTPEPSATTLAGPANAVASAGISLRYRALRGGNGQVARPERDQRPNRTLVIRNANVHNLRGVSLELPRNQLIVVTGVSGSGKSSLAFDTIYAEGQRRFVESLSSYARQFLARMPKPDVESITGLAPAIAKIGRAHV